MRDCDFLQVCGGTQQVLEKVAKMEQKLARIGFIIILVLGTCQISGILLSILVFIEGDNSTLTLNFQNGNDDFIRYVWDVIALLPLINSSVNFLIYFTLGQQFRRTCRNLCGNEITLTEHEVGDFIANSCL